MKKELKYLIFVAVAVTVVGFAAVTFMFGDVVKSEHKAEQKLENPAYPMITNLASEHSFSYGPVDAKVTVVEFFDPECESCAMVSPYIKKEMKYYEGKVRWVFRYMPYHKNSRNAVAALEALRKQDLFLEGMEILFKTQKEWGEQKEPMIEKINQVVLQIKGLKKDQYLKDLKNPQTEEILNKDEKEGKQAGIKGTPTFFVNNSIMDELDLDALIAKINAELGK